MKIYDVPTPDFDDMLPDEALEEIKQLDRAVVENTDHPLNSREHQRHEDYLAYKDRLYRAAYPPSDADDDYSIRFSGGPEENYAERTARKAEEDEAAQDDLVEQAEAELDALEELGFNRDELPEKVEEFHVRGLREQRLHAQGNYAELGSMLEADLSSLERSGGMPAGKINAVRELIRTEGVAPALKPQVDAIARDIITLIYQAKKQGVRK